MNADVLITYEGDIAVLTAESCCLVPPAKPVMRVIIGAYALMAGANTTDRFAQPFNNAFIRYAPTQERYPGGAPAYARYFDSAPTHTSGNCFCFYKVHRGHQAAKGKVPARSMAFLHHQAEGGHHKNPTCVSW